VDKLIRVYIKMRDARDVLVKELEQKKEDLDAQMAKVKGALLEYCKEQNVDSVRTSEGLFYRTVERRYWTSNWEAMGKFVLEHEAPELLEKRLHQGNMKAFLEEHPDLLPPGLNVDSEYKITVKREKRNG
jgi:hypothetical protein